MVWCCKTSEDSECLLLKDRSVKRDDNENERDSSNVTDGEYQELSRTNDPNKKSSSNNTLCCGYALAILGVVTITAGLACTQALDQSIPHSELNGLRFTAQFAIISPVLIGLKKCDVRVDRKSIAWLVCGAFMHTANSFASYGAAYYLPLGVSSGISRSLVLIFTYIISSISNKSVWWYEFIAVIMCITGVIMVTQPPFIFHGTGSSILSSNLGQNGSFQSPCGHVTTQIVHSVPVNVSTNNTLFIKINIDSASVHKETITGYIMCIASAILSTSYIQVVKKRLANVNMFVYNFWACLFGVMFSFCLMAATETPYFPTVTICIVFLFVHLFSAGSHAIVVYRAFQLLDPVLSSLILTLQIAVSFVLQYTLLSGIHPGRANVVEISGAVLIFVGNVLVPVYQLVQITHQKKDVTTPRDTS